MLGKFRYLFIGIILSALVLVGCTSKEEKVAVDDFKNAVSKVEQLNQELDKQISETENIILKKEAALDPDTLIALESAVSKAKAEKVAVPQMPKKLEDIKSETNRLNQTNYQSALKDMDDKKLNYKNSIEQLKQMTNPLEAFVIKRLESVDGITGISAVTEENDPNNKLNKPGGYTAQVYFLYNLVDQSKAYGDSIIEKGTNGGGSIEVYRTVEDAKKRNEYLKSFDSNAFVTVGSHKVVGTVIIRTSHYLTASQQKELENKLISSLTKLENN